MREIKFRAWIKKRMLYTVTVCDSDCFTLMTDENLKRLDKPTPTFHKDAIIMQFTGLKDKNGKEIYEGDIVLNEDGEYTWAGVVYWDNDDARFRADDKENDEQFGDEFVEADLKVIGNIHQNPELLKGDEN